jgi:hypothetical protein
MAKNEHGSSLLHLPIHSRVAKYLVETEYCGVNERSNSLGTPLQAAIYCLTDGFIGGLRRWTHRGWWSQQEQITQMLLFFGANPVLPNAKGETSIQTFRDFIWEQKRILVKQRQKE